MVDCWECWWSNELGNIFVMAYYQRLHAFKSQGWLRGIRQVIANDVGPGSAPGWPFIVARNSYHKHESLTADFANGSVPSETRDVQGLAEEAGLLVGVQVDYWRPFSQSKKRANMLSRPSRLAALDQYMLEIVVPSLSQLRSTSSHPVQYHSAVTSRVSDAHPQGVRSAWED